MSLDDVIPFSAEVARPHKRHCSQLTYCAKRYREAGCFCAGVCDKLKLQKSAAPTVDGAVRSIAAAVLLTGVDCSNDWEETVAWRTVKMDTCVSDVMLFTN